MKKEITVALAWGGGMVLLALWAQYAHANGSIDEDTMIRVVAMNGLAVAYYANRAPKMAAPNACAQRVTRFAGWSLVLGGLVYALLWAFAPISVAKTVGTGALALSVVATLVYCLRLRSQIQAAGESGGAAG